MDAQTVGIIVALIGVLKGKDVWDYLKSRSDSKSKGNDKVIDIYEKRISDLERELSELRELQEKIVLRMQTKILKTRGASKISKPKDI